MKRPISKQDIAAEIRRQDRESERCTYCGGGDLHSASCFALTMGVASSRTHKPGTKDGA